MKATLEFNLDDYGETLSHKQALKGREALLALHDMDNALRNAVKYQGDEVAAVWRQKLHEIMADYDINLEELIP